MRRVLLATGCLFALAAAPPAHALSVTDPVGDFAPTYVGDADPDLDVTSFTVGYDPVAEVFRIRATLAGDVDPAKPGLYVIGINTGAAVTPGPFADIFNPNVIFNRVIVMQKSGVPFIVGGGAVSGRLSANAFNLLVPLASLASTGFDPLEYGWNLWPRNGLGNNNQVSDFAPDNATITASIPEPATWALLIGGFGVAGAVLRRRHPRTAVPV